MKNPNIPALLSLPDSLGRALDVMVCDDVTVEFPLLPPSNRWQLLFKDYRGPTHIALNSVNFCVPQGKIIGVIGHNGAGKSTLLRMLAGVIEPTAGSVNRLGPVTSLFELGGVGGGGMVTGAQYVCRWLRLQGVPKYKWPSFIEDVREFSELGARLEDRISTYSSGMAARLYFATATSIGENIYLIDEVLSVGDEHFQAKCWGRIREKLGQGVSGVLVTHDWSAILRLCETACQLEGGEIVAQGDAETVIRNYLALSDTFDISSSEARFASELPAVAAGNTNEDWNFEVPIEVRTELTIVFNYSIEKLILGQEWQILILGTDQHIKCASGKWVINMSLPALPLPAGEYRLNLFLSKLAEDGHNSKVILDVRSWTNGGSLRLNVSGPKQAALACIPYSEEFQ